MGSDYSIGQGDSVTFTAPEGSGATLTINGTNYTLLYTVADLQAINNNLFGAYAIADSIDATGVSWTPLGTNGHGGGLNGGAGFEGILEGLGNTVSNLTVNTGAANSAGFVGINSGAILDVDLNNVRVTGGSLVGGLVGWNRTTGAIVNSSVDTAGSISGANQVGGFVGWNDGTVSGGQAFNVDIVGTGAGIGGFAGQNSAGASISGASVSGSNASGALTSAGTVNGVSSVGGFAGGNFGTLSNDQASDIIVGSTSTGWVGGFVGWNTNSVTTSSASDIQVIGSHGVGGFVGDNAGMIQQSDAQPAILNGAAAAVSGIGSVGGFAGTNETAGNLTNVYATGSVTGTSQAFVGGLVGVNSGAMSDAYADDIVTGPAGRTGAVRGDNGSGASVTNTYYDAALTATLPAVGLSHGVVGTIAMGGPGQPDPTQAATYVNFDFTNVWTIAAGDLPTLLHAP